MGRREEEIGADRADEEHERREHDRVVPSRKEAGLELRRVQPYDSEELDRASDVDGPMQEIGQPFPHGDRIGEAPHRSPPERTRPHLADPLRVHFERHRELVDRAAVHRDDDALRPWAVAGRHQRTGPRRPHLVGIAVDEDAAVAVEDGDVGDVLPVNDVLEEPLEPRPLPRRRHELGAEIGAEHGHDAAGLALEDLATWALPRPMSRKDTMATAVPRIRMLTTMNAMGR